MHHVYDNNSLEEFKENTNNPERYNNVMCTEHNNSVYVHS